MIGFLRFIGVVNAAIWFGAAIFFSAFVGPAFFSTDVTSLVGPPYNGVIAQVILKRYFTLQTWCALIGLLHLFAEWLYMGRTLDRVNLWILSGLMALSLCGGLWMHPKLKQLHLVKYHPQTTQEQKQQASRSFSIWHGVSQVGNLGGTLALLFYLWKVTAAPAQTRFISTTKFQ